MNRWELVQALFARTLESPPAERARLLAEVEDPALAREVGVLIAADSVPFEGLDGESPSLLGVLAADLDPSAACGEEFGNYRIEELLASGGMAHVYRAVRTSAGTERRVALKVLRPALDAAAFLARFQQERETLASLEHANIVSFLEAGALSDGRPWLSMELVEGLPLTEWGRGLPRRRRIEVFLQVLDAVRHAHAALVVHLDLKPSNILVTEQGVPKVLDFGVSAVLDARSGADAGRAAGTPRYASPEQLRGGRITTASDVYSLGVLLHELLVEAPPPAEGLAPGRPTRDLAAILKRALEPDPHARYASVESLADDLRRTLAHEPVAARPATWRYRAGRFLRRQAWPVALAAATVLASVGGWIASDLERRGAEREAGRGWSAHAQTRLTAKVLEEGWLATAGHDAGTADAAVAWLEGRLETGIDEHPETEILLRGTLARWLELQGRPAAALLQVEAALARAAETGAVGLRELERLRAARDGLRRALADRD